MGYYGQSGIIYELIETHQNPSEPINAPSQAHSPFCRQKGSNTTLGKRYTQSNRPAQPIQRQSGTNQHHDQIFDFRGAYLSFRVQQIWCQKGSNATLGKRYTQSNRPAQPIQRQSGTNQHHDPIYNFRGAYLFYQGLVDLVSEGVKCNARQTIHPKQPTSTTNLASEWC